MLLATASAGLACACCVNRGYYELTRFKPDGFYTSILDSMDFDKKAEVYLTEAGYDGTKGIEDIAAEDSDGRPFSLTMSDSFSARTWKLSFTSPKGKKGTLMLPMPASMTRYKADHHDTPKDREVVLYKEFIFSGSVASATGIFQSAARKATSYTLVFQGRGNGCDDASDFTHWRLQVNGKTADFAFFGQMKRGSSKK
jgi:hypothetical protein